MRRLAKLVFFILLCVGGGALIGIIAGPDEWYAALNKPWFNPPGWVFAPVWTALYVLIAVAGYRTWLRNGPGTGMVLWFGQLGLNFLWPLVFFLLHSLWAALAVIILLLLAILAFMAFAARRDRGSFILFIPYLLWVSFAALLNLSILWLN
jgi:tryptophan-rich sensory protein